MSMVCGLDLHRRQITFDALEVDSGDQDPHHLHVAVATSWPVSSCATADDLAELIRRELEVASGHRSRAA